MSISGISANAGVTAASQVARKQSSVWSPSASGSSTAAQDTFTSDFASILSSVQAGDITGAQAALTKLTSDQPPADASYSPSSTSAPASNAQTDLQSLLQAVQGGDLSGAQKALTSLQTDIRTDPKLASSAPVTGSGHHHHHHAKPAADSSTDSATAASSATDLSTPSATSASETTA